ncbi:MAG: GDSL-type esterase/lipase family protein [Acidobacteriales bacterium]|nr:GDSL-type esterase/lipase family protein [Terriglobales bacterium]
MKKFAYLIAVLAFAGTLAAQTDPLMPPREALQMYDRALQLMESTTVATPELGRAGLPVIENCRTALGALREAPGQNHPGLTYAFVSNLKTFLMLGDAVPKPFPYPDQARKQFAELRDLSTRMESHFRALLDQKERGLRSPDRDNLHRYAEDNSRLGAPHPGKPRVVFFGDSITDSWRLNEYFPERDFVNRGISGQVTGEMLGRFKADVIDLKPAAVIILAGTNDIGRQVPLTTIQNNLSMIADLAVAHKIKPIFATLLPVSDYHKNVDPNFAQTRRRPPTQIRSLNDWLIGFTREHGFVYLDYFSKMVDSSGMLRTDLSDDGLHPNAAGYRVMAPLAISAIEKAAPGAAPAPAKESRKKRLGVF